MKIDINKPDQLGVPPLTWAAGAKNLEMVKVLLDAGADVNAPDEDGGSPILWACWNSENDSNFEVIKTLIEHGANPDSANLNGVTILMRCASNNSVKTVQLLIDKGANPTLQDRDGRTAKYWYSRFAAGAGWDKPKKEMEEILDKAEKDWE